MCCTPEIYSGSTLYGFEMCLTNDFDSHPSRSVIMVSTNRSPRGATDSEQSQLVDRVGVVIAVVLQMLPGSRSCREVLKKQSPGGIPGLQLDISLSLCFRRALVTVTVPPSGIALEFNQTAGSTTLASGVGAALGERAEEKARTF